ncbi:riboflavin synthase [Mastigocoleus testarum]|uniref:Riboflavin synthase n=1 Tax=Mastigocoleus testarum BC008 TaxID=371196 RepID=A0A0V7ZPJ4_9CYAN|nr:riboflavin synthase [Mastigocoleus testarum]KST66547.1 riboflavin synthase subunit alpha [Mastigocoleus testarum BC008]
MFTGLIQALGTIRPLEGNYWQINCIDGASAPIMQDLAFGDSVAVNGVCLSVETILPDGFIVTASPETLQRTTLGKEETLQISVNLETSLRVGSKIGGHFVMGHVDGIGRLVQASKTATSWEMTFSVPHAIAHYLVPKGSIAINGISLTVAQYQPDDALLKVAVIPITYVETNLCHLVPGSWVNLEGDILGKYVEKFITNGKVDYPTTSDSEEKQITPVFLAEHGYL